MGSYSCYISFFLKYLSIFNVVKQDRTGSQRVVCNKRNNWKSTVQYGVVPEQYFVVQRSTAAPLCIGVILCDHTQKDWGSPTFDSLCSIFLYWRSASCFRAAFEKFCVVQNVLAFLAAVLHSWQGYHLNGAISCNSR